MIKDEKGRPMTYWGGLNKNADGYWCVICQRFIEADEDGLIVHDDITHPNNMTFDDEEKPQ
jgi:hypothetical protein